MRDGILKGIRGPHGGYTLARPQDHVTAEDILHAAESTMDADEPALASPLVNTVVRPALDHAERSFSAVLREITVEHMVQKARAA